MTSSYHASVPRLRTGLSVQQPSGSWSQTYGYDAARRLQTVGGPAGTFTYTYKGPGTVWTNLVVPTSPTAAITNAYDSGGRLTGTWLRNNAGTILNQHTYLYNGGGQRQRQTITDNSYTTYGYDDDAQLTSALGYTSGGSPVAAEQLGFGYDGGWNMTSRSVNGSPTAYGVNDWNQVTTIGGLGAGYDANGNRRTQVYDASGPKSYVYTYDDENQLISVATDTTYTAAANRWKREFVYDGRGRLRVRKEYNWPSTGWVLQTETRYLYDGMRVVQERNGSNVPLVGYTRGQDLSGSLEGAGGIGGLLARSHGYSGGSWSTHSHYHADGNGNVTYLVNGSAGMVASYRYDAYGRTLSASGSLAAANVYRFSSKELHVRSGMYYYGYRSYDPNTQRWLNRDPLGEEGGINLYTCLDNSPTEAIDPHGLQADSVSKAACRPDAAGQIAREHLLDVLKARQRQLIENAGKKAAEQAAKVLKKKIKKAEKLMRTDRDFRDWVHRELKPRLPKSADGRGNHNLTPEELVEAMEYYFGW